MSEATEERQDSKSVWGWIAFAALLIGGFGYALHYSSDQSENVRALKAVLRDPSSAEVSELNTVDGVTCGLVNAKNGMGGYTGRQLFIVDHGVAYTGDEVSAKLNPDDGPSVCSLDALMVLVRQGS